MQDKNKDEHKKVIRARQASESYFHFKNDFDVEDYKDSEEVNDESENVYVSEFIIHPDWDPKENRYTADIAIVVLKKPMELSNKVRHICLNTPANPIQSFTRENAKVYGWGLTEHLEIVTELRDVEVPLVDQKWCYK